MNCFLHDNKTFLNIIILMLYFEISSDLLHRDSGHLKASPERNFMQLQGGKKNPTENLHPWELRVQNR